MMVVCLVLTLTCQESRLMPANPHTTQAGLLVLAAGICRDLLLNDFPFHWENLPNLADDFAGKESADAKLTA